jgi:membrane protein required for colicin V production
MSYLDIIFVVLFAWSVYKGFTKGLILQLATLAGLLLGIYGALKFSDSTAELLSPKIDVNEQTLSVVAFALTFLIILVAVILIGKLIEKINEAIELGLINKLLGAFLSMLKMAFIISVLLVLVNKADTKYNFISNNTKEKSLLYKPLSNFAPIIFPYLKFDKIREKFEEKNTNEETYI